MHQRLAAISSVYVRNRHVDLWLPPGYDPGGSHRYPVLYCQDGQYNCLPMKSLLGWGLCETAGALMEEGSISPFIVANIWNTPDRWREYVPQKPVERFVTPKEQAELRGKGKFPTSDLYLAYLLEELIPAVEASCNAKPSGDARFLMGSSLGAAVSLYALCEYPNHFKGAACLSTHWPLNGGALLPYLDASLPDPTSHRLYFDISTESLDTQYVAYHPRVCEILYSHGFLEGISCMNRVWRGHDHSAASWGRRVHVPLSYLFS